MNPNTTSPRRYAATLAVIAGALLASTGAATAAGHAPRASQADDLTEISFQTFPNLAMGVPIRVAQEQGIFEQNGLEVSTSDGAAGPAMVAAIVAGQVDLAGVPNFVAMQSMVAGVELQTIVGLTGGGGSVIFVGNDIDDPDSDYPESAQVLNGAVMAAAAPGGFSDRLYQFLIDDAGISDTQIVTLPGVAENLAAIDAGRVDVANLDLIASFRGQQEGIGYVLYDFQETGPQAFRGASTNSVWASTDFIADHPDAAEAFTRSIAQADAWLNDPGNREAARTYFAEVAGFDVPDELLDKLLASLEPVVSVDDLATYAQLLEDPEAFDPQAALSPMAPQDDAALIELIGP